MSIKSRSEITPNQLTNVMPTGRNIKQIVNGEFVNCLWAEAFIFEGSDGLELRLTISFGTAVVETWLGKFEVGLRRGDLQIALHGAMAPLEKRWPAREMNPLQEVEHTTRISEQEDATRKRGATGSARFGPGTAGLDIKSETEKKSGRTSDVEESYKIVHARIRTEGPPAVPRWVFQALPDERAVEGELRRQILAQLDQIGATIAAIAGFRLPFDKNICLHEGEGILIGFAGMEAKRKGIFNGIIRKIIARRFRESLSDVELLLKRL